MSCEQEQNSTKDTCIFLPNVLFVQKNGQCPNGYVYYENPTPVCIDKTTIPFGYDCTRNPLQCTRPRIFVEGFQYNSIRHAYN
jgi:hypothetical protein